MMKTSPLNLKKEHKECLEYIEDYWEKITFKTEEDDGLLIGLPERYLAPSHHEEFQKKMYYWDSYFTILGLLASDRVELAKEIVENFSHLIEKYNIVPASNRFYHLAKSQPPFFSSMVVEIYKKTNDEEWLEEEVEHIEKEYEEVWNSRKRTTDNGLNRYFDQTHYHQQAEDESGWDRTSRFFNKCLDINPIDLNALLYKYETDLSYIHSQLVNDELKKSWGKKASERKERVNEYMWSEEKGFFFDYDHGSGKRTEVYSLAGYFPLWAGMASEKQAEKAKEKLELFEEDYGLATTDKKYLDEERQWDWPNGWAPLHWIVFRGLLNYGYEYEAERIAKKWINLCQKVFEETGKFWEKYNVCEGEVSRIGRYPTQSGFGWTNAVFLKMVEHFS